MFYDQQQQPQFIVLGSEARKNVFVEQPWSDIYDDTSPTSTSGMPCKLHLPFLLSTQPMLDPCQDHPAGTLQRLPFS